MLVSVDPGLIIWTIITFLILAFLLGRFGWKPIVAALNQREENIGAALEEARKAHEEARELREEYRGLIDKADEEAREIIQVARDTAETLKRDTEAAAREEGQRLLEQARRDIDNAKEAALRDIRDVVADLAVEAAGKIVRETLDAERHRDMVDDLIARLPATKRS